MPWSLLASALLLLGCAPRLPQSEPHEVLGRVPEAALRPTLRGDLVTVPAPRLVTMVDFWATFCQPCIELMPLYEEVWQDYRDRHVAVIGVAADDNPGLVGQRLNELGVTYPNVLDDDGILQGRYRVRELPRTLLFDTNGRLRLVLTGKGTAEAERFRTGIEALLAE